MFWGQVRGSEPDHAAACVRARVCTYLHSLRQVGGKTSPELVVKDHRFVTQHEATACLQGEMICKEKGDWRGLEWERGTSLESGDSYSSDHKLSKGRGMWKASGRVYQADPPLGHHSSVEPTFIESFVLETITLIFKKKFF